MTGTGPSSAVHPAALAALVDRLREVPARGPGFVLLTGRSGDGRTTLLRELAARHQGPVLWSTAAPWETRYASGILLQLLPDLSVTPDSAVDDPVAGAARIARWVAASRDTVLAVVDDAQWADALSLQALASAVRHHRDARLLVVAATVTGDADIASPAPDLLHHIATGIVRVGPLTVAEVGQLAARHGIALHPSMAERLCRHTGGVARDVEQLLAEVPPQVWAGFDPDLPAPAAVTAEVRAALGDCAPSTRRLIESTAVLGTGTAVRDAAALAGIDDDLITVLDEAARTGLVRLGPQGLTEIGPADPMLRAAVLAGMGPAATAALRCRAAESTEDPVRRLRLLVAATPVPDTDLADRLDALATEQAAQGAWGTAAALLRDASRLTDDRLSRESRLTRAVDALIGAGDIFAAAALIPEVESLRETPLRNAVLGYLAMVRGRPAEAEIRLARAWDLVNSEREPEQAALICQRYVLHALCRCRPTELVDWADRAIALVGSGNPAAVEAAAIRGLGLVYGRTEEARRSYAELSQQVRTGAQVQRIMMGRGWLSLIADEFDDARADLEGSVPTTYLGGSTRISLWARAWLARVQFLTGDWDDALRTVAEAAELVDRTGIVLSSPLLHWTATSVHCLRGDWAEAQSSLQHTATGPQDYEIMRVPSYLARAQWAEARADSAGVLRALHPMTQAWAWNGPDDPGQWPWADMYAHALVTEARYDEADAFLTRHERHAADLGRPSAQARLRVVRGQLFGACGDLEHAREAFAGALEQLEGMPLRYDRARAGLSFGQMLRRAGKRREADAELSTARDLFAALDARTYVTRCDRELKAAGVRAQRTGRSGDQLTPQEEAVAALVARGLPNREVAAELFITAKTVQYHLTRIYTKLGIRSRAELAALRGES
ncbi:LuxR C-terminal-related transcriptional regulator [Nocardia sp. NEAU-G5]|uniref:LuxR C-terminal-related transcriptional regulator n=1 Tax=Nocardia albiluteola TaxID=2842303 RepID=A0ABS6BEK3_9NOCA|nr:LuxR family transcriptional regulator [Nocardia albiluteola]MBU3067855.1 LuxR C-terminal-related transcriptional regulator [Nocardia albiluteola]